MWCEGVTRIVSLNINVARVQNKRALEGFLFSKLAVILALEKVDIGWLL